MRKFAWIGRILVLVLVCGITVSAQKADISVALGSSKTDKASKLKVTFVSVKEDSRCPEETQCIWAGRAIIAIKVEDATGGSKVADLELGGATDSFTFGGHIVKLISLAPAPRSGEAESVRKYIAGLTITDAQPSKCQ